MGEHKDTVRTAVIMAAGTGTRFGRYTERIPKGFVEAGGRPMILRSMETLLSCGLRRIVIGTGYKAEWYEGLKGDWPMIETCFSPRYAETNSMYTLWNMRRVIGEEDFILLESDLVFNRNAILPLLDSDRSDVMLASPVTKFQDQYYVEYDDDGILTNCSVCRDAIEAMGEFVGISRLSSPFYVRMCEDYSGRVQACPKLGYEYELLRMSRCMIPLYVHKELNMKWYEIDDVDDLLFAEKNVIPYL